MLGLGAYGVTCRVKQRRRGGGLAAMCGLVPPQWRSRKFVVKRSLRADDWESLENEQRWLEVSVPLSRVQGEATGSCLEVKRVWKYPGRILLMIEKWLRGALHIVQPVQLPSDPLSKLNGPSLIMELVENGSLLDFYERLVASKITLPNRFLWRIFLCCA
jgi:hypothetical protein